MTEFSSDQLTELLSEGREHQDSYALAKSYACRGDLITTRDPILRRAVTGTGAMSTRFNVTGRIVKAYASRLLLSEPEVDGMDALPEWLAANQWVKQARRHILDVLTYGRGVMLNWVYTDSDGAVRASMLALDPTSAKVICDCEGAPTYGLRFWDEMEGGKTLTYLYVYTETELSRFVTSDGGKTWLPHTEEGETDSVIPYSTGFPMFETECGTEARPVHEDAYGCQDMVVTSVLVNRTNIRFLGWPQVFALYSELSASGTSDLGDTMRNDTGESNFAQEEVRTLKRDPGSIWALRAKQLGTLDPADPMAAIEVMRAYIELASSLSGVPSRYFSAPGGQQPSAESQQALDAEFRQHVAEIGIGLKETFRAQLAHALTAVGVRSTTPTEVALDWLSPEIVGDKTSWDVAGQQAALGVPTDVLLVERGYTPKAAKEFVTNGGTELAMLQRVQVLQQLGDAVTKLSAATATGVLTAEQIGGVINKLFGALSDG